MPKIHDNLVQVRQRIQTSAQLAARDANEITLLAVSKTKPASDIEEAYRAGQRDFGENYVQEALLKCQQLGDLDLIWHFIGPIQTNKTRALAEHFHWVHSVDRLKIAQRLSEQRPQHLAPLNICLQVNIDDQPTKAGCTPEQACQLAQAVAALPQLRLRGLMAIPAMHSGRAPFLALANLRAHIAAQTGLELDTLSMGMSDDLDDAIAAGATMVRVGTAIFGARASAPD
jgi:PLP dependent protein